MKKKYLLLISMLAVCCALGGCKKKEDAAKVSPSEEPTIITKDDSVSGQVVEMQQGSNIDKSKITNIMGVQTATSSDVVLTNLTGDEISAFYARPSGEEEWGDDYVEGKFTLKNNDKALFYYEKNAEATTGTASVKYDLRVSFADASKDDCFFRELTLTDIQELSLNLEDGVPYVKYQSLSTKQQVSTLSEARKRMGLEDVNTSGNSAGAASNQTTVGTGRSNANANANGSTNTNGNASVGVGGSTADPSQGQPADTNPGTDSSTSNPSETTSPGESGGDGNGGNDIPPGLNDGQGQDVRDTAQDYVGQDMDNLVGEIGTANATEYGTDEATGNTIIYHYYDGFAVSATEDSDGNQTVTGIW